MKYLKPIYNFLNEEALPLNLAKEFTRMAQQRPDDVKRRLNEIMDGQQRVYVPVGSYSLENESYLKIKKYLNSIGYDIKDYKLGIAFEIDNPKREIRIGKILNKENQSKLLKLFTEDTDRALSKQQSKYSIVICQHPYDIAGMSYGTGRETWQDRSCLNVIKGVNKHYLPAEIEKGTLTVYLIKSEDKNINAPLGRINIKPYFDVSVEEYEDDVDSWIWAPDINTYGAFSDDAKKTLIDWILTWQTEEFFEEGEVFSKVKGLYSDHGSPQFLSYTGSFADMIETEWYNLADLRDVEGNSFYYFLDILNSQFGLEAEDIEIVDVDYYDDADGGYAITSYDIKIKTDFIFDYYKLKDSGYTNHNAHTYFLNTLSILEVDGDLTIFAEDDSECMDIFSRNCVVNGDLTINVIDCSADAKNFKVTTNLNKERTTVKFSQINTDSYSNYVQMIFRGLPDGKLINFESEKLYPEFLDGGEADEFLYFLHKYCNNKNVDLYTQYGEFSDYCEDEGFDEDSEEYQNISEFMDKLDFLISKKWKEEGMANTYDTGLFQFRDPSKIKDYIMDGKIIFPIKHIYSDVVDLSYCGLTTLENFPNFINGSTNTEEMKKCVLNLTGNELTSLEGLPTSIGTIILKDNKITDIDGIDHPSSILTNLDLSGNYLESVDGIMKWYRNLKELKLDNQKSGKVINYKVEENSHLTEEERDFIDRHNIMFDLFDEGYVIKGDLHIKEEDIKIKIHSVGGNFTVEQVDLTKDINVKNFPMIVKGNLTIMVCKLDSFSNFSNRPGGYRNLVLGGDLTLDSILQLKSLDGLILMENGSRSSSKLSIINCEDLEDINYVDMSGSVKFRYVTIERCEELKDLSNLENILQNEGSVRLSNLDLNGNIKFNNGQRDVVNNFVINKSLINTFKNFPNAVWDGIYINECNLKNIKSFDGFPYNISRNTTISFRGCSFSEELGGGDIEIFKQKYMEYIESKMGVGKAPENLMVEIKK